MEEPKAVVMTGTLTLAPSGESKNSGRSGGSSERAGSRLSDRIRSRLERRNTNSSRMGVGGPPLSPRSETSTSVTLRSASQTSSNATPLMRNTTSAFQRRSNRNRSYEDRVNLLLTKGSEEEEESFPRNKTSPSAIDSRQLVTIAGIASGIIANIANKDRSETDSDFEDDDSSHTSGSTDDGRSAGSSTMMGNEDIGRSFSPIYEGVQDPVSSNPTEPEDEGFGAASGDPSLTEQESRDPSDGEKMDNGRKSSASAGSRPSSFSFYQAATSSSYTKKIAPVDTPKRGISAGSHSSKYDPQVEATNTRSLQEPSERSADPPEDKSDPSPAKGPHSNRQRVPGGAAAKLMLLGPRRQSEELSSEDDEPGDIENRNSAEADHNKTLDEISSTISKAKSEFVTGGEQNRRYNPTSKDRNGPRQAGNGQSESNSDRVSDLPNSSLFNRSEVFHKNANAAVMALLAPRVGGFITDSQSFMSGPGDVQSVYSNAQSVSNSAFQPPKQVNSGEAAFESLSRRDVSLRLITKETEIKLEKLKDTMRDPDKTLAELLTAIHTKEDDDPELGFQVRRKNACGALQLMTVQANNRVPIAWTVGVLPALASVLRDTGDGVHASYPDKRHRIEFESARDRAIACLMNLCMPPSNRIAIFHTPDLVPWLVVIINEGHGVARKGACAILAYLAKTAENRLLMAKVPGMIDALDKVLKPMPPRLEHIKVVKRAMKEGVSDVDPGEDDGEEGRIKLGVTAVSSSFSRESEKASGFKASQTPIEIKGYDETADPLLRAARQNVFAILLHLVKEKDNAYHFARHDSLMATLAAIANHHESPSHLLSIKILASATRHLLNTKILVFKQREVVPSLVKGTKATDDSTRLFSCYGLQNLAQDKSCRQELAVAKDLISSLCDRSRKAKAVGERLAAISAIKNLCDEPANLIPMTNTPDCIATLMHLAHGMEEGITELMQYRACDALATLSHWLRKIATSGLALENSKAKKPPPKSLFVPSLQVVPYNQWK